ncbi:ficolin-1-like [Clytia hemisphaerica]|uniref:ficolin-1-like n=1 Tax=Clytia hemisphaerica TaxID=252671 RepID=UPI0034D747DA
MFENTVIKGMDPVLETNTTSVLECQLLSQHPTRFMINVLKVFDHWYHCRIFMNKKSPKMDKEYFQDHTNSTVYILDKPKPKDCQDWKTLGYDKDGLYDIVIDRKSVQVWCDMTNFDGGWIVFQKRFNNSVDFNRDWEEYKDGFGQINGGEFWLGNEHLHRLTWGKSVQFIFEVEDTDGVTRYGRHDSFFISSEDDFYRMSSDMRVMDGMGGFGLVKGQPFSTTGSDHDSWPYGNCADRFQGGWWYNDCGTAFFNGINDPSVEFYGIRFTAWNNLKDKVRTKMMIKVA